MRNSRLTTRYSRFYLQIAACVLQLFLYGCAVLPQFVITKDILTAEEHTNLGAAYESKGELDLAAKEYKKAIEKDSNYAIAYFNLGNIHLKKGSYDEAEGYYLSAIEKSPSNGIFYNNLAWLYIYGKYDLKTAEKYALDALKLDPSKKHIYLDTLGVIYTYKKEFKKAEEILMDALKSAPNGDVSSLVQIYKHLSDVYDKIGDKENYLNIKEKVEGLNHK